MPPQVKDDTSKQQTTKNRVVSVISLLVHLFALEQPSRLSPRSIISDAKPCRVLQKDESLAAHMGGLQGAV